ncbi:uncharacterized protein [Henckelia pumila]|uniref:uncharacterized protein n=1 Tax=Henckelia pumila TaxID=405737 RepID=UPI003C6DF381
MAGDTGPNSPLSINWKFVWRLGVPAKVRIFLWRVLFSCLPTMKAPRTCRAEVNGCCPICHNLPEDDFHALVSCPWTISVWSLSSIGSYLESSGTFAEWWNNMTHRRDRNEVELVAAILWCLWQNRYDVVWNGNCIVRNSNDVVLDVVHGILNGRYSPIESEAMEIREALSWVKSKNLSNVIFESDALVVIEALHNTEHDYSCLGLIVEDCRTLARNIQSCNFVFVKRSANQAVHALALEIFYMSGLVRWITPSPTLISNIISFDLV